MNPDEEMRLEAALRKIKAAQPPPDFMARLHAAGPPRPSERPANAVGIVTGGTWTGLLRWLSLYWLSHALGVLALAPPLLAALTPWLVRHRFALPDV